MTLFWLIPVILAIAFWAPKDDSRSRWALVAMALLAVPLLGILHMVSGFGFRSGMMRGGWMGGHGPRPEMMGGPGMMGFSPLSPWISLTVGLLALAALVWLGYWAVKRFPTIAEDEPMKILKMRLAKGEINPEEFDALKAKLQG